MALHVSDISNPCRPQELAVKWAGLILSEFFAQGDVEKSKVRGPCGAGGDVGRRRRRRRSSLIITRTP